jgi:putative spermidine/putrescine transport system permease protein
MSPTLRRNTTVVLLLLPGLGLVVGFIGVVLYFAVAQSLGQYSFTGNDGWTLDHWRRVLVDPSFRRSFGYSLRIATISAIGAVALAYPLAMWLRTPFRGSTVVGAVAKIPLLVPGLVAAFLYVNFISHNGFLNHGLQWVGLIGEPLRLQNDRFAIGVIILQLWKQMPLALLLLLGAVRSVSDDVLDAARDVGASAATRFTQIILPLTLQALQAAMIIIFIGAAGDFSFQVVAGPRSPFSLAQLMESAKTASGDRNYSAVIGVLLMVTALLGSVGLAGLARLAINRRSYA